MSIIFYYKTSFIRKLEFFQVQYLVKKPKTKPNQTKKTQTKQKTKQQPNHRSLNMEKTVFSRGQNHPSFPSSCIILYSVSCYFFTFHPVSVTIRFLVFFFFLLSETATFSTYTGSKLFSILLQCLHVYIMLHKNIIKTSVRKQKVYNGKVNCEVRDVTVDICFRRVLQKDGMRNCLLQSMVFS